MKHVRRSLEAVVEVVAATGGAVVDKEAVVVVVEVIVENAAIAGRLFRLQTLSPLRD
jgi:hypothetical protein